MTLETESEAPVVGNRMRRVTGAEFDFIRVLMLFNIWWLGTRVYGHPGKALRVMTTLMRIFENMNGRRKPYRAFRINGKYVRGMFNPPWPSRAFNSFFTSQLHEIEPISDNHTSLRRLLIAITKKCPLQCEHCSESETLYQDDVLSFDQLRNRIEPFVKQGVGQLVFSGGEPLSRFDDLTKLLNYFRKDCDQWIYSSGYGLTLQKARALKQAGLNGAAISLDHHLEECHNKFRGNSKSFFWVKEAIANCQAVGIMTALNMCPTKDYIQQFDLNDYAKLAKELNVPQINILEPRSVGNYKGKNVELDLEHREKLYALSDKYNFDQSLIDFPTLSFPAAHRRSLPCGGGRSYLFLDFDGKLYPCPFCKVQVSGVSLKEKACLAQ